MRFLIMLIKNKKTSKKDEKIDAQVIGQANDEKVWDKKQSVTPATKPTSIRLSPRTIERAQFFAKVHHARGYQTWLKRIIEERINTEYEVYKNLKQHVA